MTETRATDSPTGSIPAPRRGDSSKPATETVVAQQRQLLASLPFSDEQDFQDARRGFIAALEPSTST